MSTALAAFDDLECGFGEGRIAHRGQLLSLHTGIDHSKGFVFRRTTCLALRSFGFGLGIILGGRDGITIYLLQQGAYNDGADCTRAIRAIKKGSGGSLFFFVCDLVLYRSNIVFSLNPLVTFSLIVT